MRLYLAGQHPVKNGKKMRLYLAGNSEKKQLCKDTADNKMPFNIKNVNILESFYYLRNNTAFIPHIHKFGSFLLDSGAFTFLVGSHKGGEKHCGKCGTCVERKEALRDARIEDKTEYES